MSVVRKQQMLMTPEAVEAAPALTLPELMTLLQPPDHVPGLYWLARRVFDACLALAILGLGAPLFLLIAVAIKLESRGPVLFHQIRVGQGLKWFSIYKFRTMHQDVSPYPIAIFDEKTQEYRRPKTSEDPRVTRVGKFLRQFSLDELPQVLNVLVGEMSFIGPRPLALAESMSVPLAAIARYSVPAGITGLAQIRDRYVMIEQKRFDHDLEYVRTLGFKVDLKILRKTLGRMYDKS